MRHHTIAGATKPLAQAAYLLWIGDTLLHKQIQHGSTGLGIEELKVGQDSAARPSGLFLPKARDEITDGLQEKASKTGRIHGVLQAWCSAEQ